jgi:hypothetical protein
MNILTNPASLIAHNASPFRHWPTTNCGLQCALWPLARHLRPWRFCKRCFRPHERELLAEMLPDITEAGPR